jgi:hypothetical protein
MTRDYLPRELLQGVRNLTDFARVLVLDKWTCNSDGRQAIFCKAPRGQRYSATFIGQGYCFNAGEWTFPGSPLRGAYANNCVYGRVMGWEAFEPAPSRPNRWMRTQLGGTLPIFPKSGTNATMTA